MYAGVLASDGTTTGTRRPAPSSTGSSGPASTPRPPGWSSRPPAGSPGSHPRGPGPFSGRRSRPRAASSRNRSPDGPAAGALAGQVRRDRVHLGVQLPAHEGGAGVPRAGADLGAADRHRRRRRHRPPARRRRSAADRAPGLGSPRGLRPPAGRPAVHPVRPLRDPDHLRARRHRQRRDPHRHRARDPRDPPRGSGHRPAAGRGRRRLRRRRDDHAAVDLHRGPGPRRLRDGARRRRELRGGLDLQPALPRRCGPRRPRDAGGHPAHRAGAHGPGLAGVGGRAPRGRRRPRRAPGGHRRARMATARVHPGPGRRRHRVSPTSSSSTSSAAPGRSSARRSPTSSRVVSVLLGVLVLGERLGTWQLVGFAVVLAAAWVVNRSPRSPEAVVTRARERSARV